MPGFGTSCEKWVCELVLTRPFASFRVFFVDGREYCPAYESSDPSRVTVVPSGAVLDRPLPSDNLQLPPFQRLIKLATNPAPKPLSMLTTVTFEAHEFSIPSSAAIPPKLAP